MPERKRESQKHIRQTKSNPIQFQQRVEFYCTHCTVMYIAHVLSVCLILERKEGGEGGQREKGTLPPLPSPPLQPLKKALQSLPQSQSFVQLLHSHHQMAREILIHFATRAHVFKYNALYEYTVTRVHSVQNSRSIVNSYFEEFE